MKEKNEHKSAQLLRSKEGFFEYVVKQNRMVAAVFSIKDFKVEFLTENAENIIGVPREKLMEDVRNLISLGVRIDEEKPPSEESLIKLPKGGRMDAEILEVKNPTTGESRYFRGSIIHIDISDMDRFLLIWADITEEVKRNRQMEEMIEVAKAANAAKTTFLANMSHDFRTPMNAITNFNLLIAKNSDNPQKVRDYTHKIGLACQNLYHF